MAKVWRRLNLVVTADGGVKELISDDWASEPDNSEDAAGPKVRLARELMGAAFLQGEWRQMGVRAVRKGCEQEAKARRVQLPSPDSFSRAMGRRAK